MPLAEVIDELIADELIAVPRRHLDAVSLTDLMETTDDHPTVHPRRHPRPGIGGRSPTTRWDSIAGRGARDGRGGERWGRGRAEPVRQRRALSVRTRSRGLLRSWGVGTGGAVAGAGLHRSFREPVLRWRWWLLPVSGSTVAPCRNERDGRHWTVGRNRSGDCQPPG